MRVKIGSKDALIMVDVQKDFTPGGALPVPEGDMVVPVLNRYQEKFLQVQVPVYATRDWHPQNHVSFKDQGGTWPPHCVQNTEGAKFYPNLKMSEEVEIISKGKHPQQEAYSGFQGTELEESLRKRDVERVFVGGLATDYCVKDTVLDALKLGFEVFLLEDAIKGVDVNPEDSRKAIEEMERAGAVKIGFTDVL